MKISSHTTKWFWNGHLLALNGNCRVCLICCRGGDSCKHDPHYLKQHWWLWHEVWCFWISKSNNPEKTLWCVVFQELDQFQGIQSNNSGFFQGGNCFKTNVYAEMSCSRACTNWFFTVLLVITDEIKWKRQLSQLSQNIVKAGYYNKQRTVWYSWS